MMLGVAQFSNKIVLEGRSAAHCRPCIQRCQNSNSRAPRPFRQQCINITPSRRPSIKNARQCTRIYANSDWNEDDFVKASLHMVQQGLGAGSSVDGGYLLFLQDKPESEPITENDDGLVLTVGGDTFQAIIMLLQGTQHRRPLTVDLLWSVLQRGHEISKKDWRLLRMAIVDMKDSTFIGRLYFGDPETGKIAWDVDCRPSDGTWLALKTKTPIFVNKRVWKDNVVPLSELNGDTATGGQNNLSAGAAGGEEDLLDATDPTVIMTTIANSDPEPLKRLKMEMRVALKDEDYTAAARIRDHPFTKLYLASMAARRTGNTALADEIDKELDDEISKFEKEAGEATEQ